LNIALSTALDIIVAFIIVASIIVGFNKGLVRSVIGLFGKIISLIAAFFLSENLGAYIDRNFVHSPLRQWLINQLSPTADNVKASLSSLDLDSLFAERPDFFTSIAKLLDFDLDQYAETYESIKVQGIEQAKAAITDLMISPLSSIISRVLAFIIIFIICSIGVAVLWWLSDLIINLPIVHILDKFGGIIFGLLNGILIVFVVTAVFGLSSQYLLKSIPVEDQDSIVKRTVVYKYFKSVDPIADLLSDK